MKTKLTLRIKIRSILFWLLAGLSLPFYCVVALLISPLKIQIRHQIMATAASYFTFLLKYITGVHYQVKGLENVSSTPMVFAGNHQSAWETMAMNHILPKTAWILKQELLKIPFFGWVIYPAAFIAINRSRGEAALNQVIKQGKIRHKQGFWIMCFPEGTRVKPKARKPFKYGVAKLAISLDLPIIPYAHNAGFRLPKNGFWIYPGLVTIVIGKPIYPENKDPIAFTHQLETWIWGELEKMGS